MKLSQSLIAAVVVISLGAGCSRNRLGQAQRYELQGKNAEALAIYEKTLADGSIHSSTMRSEILLRIGECLYRMDRMSDAFASFQKAVETNPQNNIARLRTGEMLLAAGSFERAREQALQVLDRMATNEDALALLGAGWMAADQPSLAKQAYERVLELNPKRVTVAVALADIYNRDDESDKAREILNQAVKAQPSSAMPLLALARLEEQQGQSNAAEDAYRRAVATEDTAETNLRLAHFLQRAARIAEAEQVLRRVDAQRQSYPVALGDFQFSAGHVGDALERYRAGLEENAISRSTAPLQYPPGTLGSVAAANNRSQLLARVLEAEIVAVADLREDKTRALCSIAERLKDVQSELDAGTLAVLQTELAMASNNLVQARVFADTALSVAPDSAAAHYVAGLTHWNSGNKEQAAVEWNSALELDDRYVPARLALAGEAIERRDGLAANEFARVVVREEPGTFRGLVLFSRALLLQKQPSSAEIMAHRAALLDPSSPEPALLMGEALLQQDRVPEALLNYERAVVAHPDSEEAMQGLMQIYRRGSVPYAALQKMERTAMDPPVSAPLLEIAGRLYADRGWYREAIQSFNAALHADPKRNTAARQLAKLRLSIGDLPKASAEAAKSGGRSEALLTGFDFQTSGNWDRAATNYERALREGDQSGVAANNLAWLYAEKGTQLDRALQLAEDAARLSPNNPAILDTLGYVQWKRREYTIAVKTLETAAQLAKMKPQFIEPGVADEIRKHLMDAYFSAGQTEAAVQIAQRRSPIGHR
jgi:tetratricopeptide (TPR) repeat protein